MASKEKEKKTYVVALDDAYGGPAKALVVTAEDDVGAINKAAAQFGEHEEELENAEWVAYEVASIHTFKAQSIPTFKKVN